MRICLHIGMEQCGAARLQQVLDGKRGQLAQKGVLFARTPGGKNHTRLYMAATDPDHVDQLRANRGYGDAGKQRALAEALMRDLTQEVEKHRPDTLILSASQLASLPHRSEIERLQNLLAPLSEDIRIIAHVDEQAQVLARHYAEQVFSGRTASLDVELAMAGTRDWHGDALAKWPEADPARAQYGEVQAPAHWLDYAALVGAWEAVFGDGSVTLRPYDAKRFASDKITDEIREAFGIDQTIGKAGKADLPAQPAAAWLTRGRMLNGDLIRLLDTGRTIPRQLWRRFMNEVAVRGEPIDPATLPAISKTFAAANKALVKAHPALTASALKPLPAAGPWQEAEPGFGFRASQYAAAFLPRIERATREARLTQKNDAAQTSGNGAADGLTPDAEKLMTPLAKENFAKLRGGPFAPHNRLGRVNEEELAAPYTEIAPRELGKKNSGNVIVGCMKNEGPYILEWVAYHRQIGVDNFIIYTNGCEDGTAEILDRLQEMGIVQHRNNDNWKGNSPQQHALNQSLKEDVIRNAEWIVHIDVDEFMNIRTGNGTLADFFAHVPDATNVAMTWRLFGNNGVDKLSDDLVIEQFDTCAPKFCPKPHTVWGFKTMFKNIKAYEKISCHRPNKLKKGKRGQVRWVNGSGKPMGDEVLDNGWRSSKGSIGYDLIQLNHYALRSAESFLIKRQRGRALHVDRSIGINYWVRMDWSDHKDVTIQRGLPRTRAEMDRLLEDEELRKWHAQAQAWHRQKADALHATPEFQELYQQTRGVKLTEMERVAYALALDMES